MKQPIGSYARVRIQGDGRQAVSQAGSVLLIETVRLAWCEPLYCCSTAFMTLRAMGAPSRPPEMS